MSGEIAASTKPEDARDTMATDVRIDSGYRRELVRRVDLLVKRGATLREIAAEAEVTRQSLWRFLRESERRATAEQAEAVRHAIMAMDPHGPKIPPPVTVTMTGGPSSASWRAALRSERRR